MAHLPEIDRGGTGYGQGGIFREVEPPNRLVFTFAWEEEGERGMGKLVTLFSRSGAVALMTFSGRLSGRKNASATVGAGTAPSTAWAITKAA